MKHLLLIFVISTYSINTFCSNFFDEVKEDASSPFNTNALNILEIGGGLTFLTFVFKDTFRQDLQNDVSSDHPLGKYSKLGDLLGKSVPNLAYVIAMGSDYLLTKDQLALDRSILMAKATIYSGAVTNIIKTSARETRPNGGSYSFPSGHATVAFAFSSLVTMEHSLPWGIAANAMATFVGFSRMNDNAHYLHDVLAGATIGTMYGIGVYNAFQNRENKKNPSSAFLILPLENGLAGNYYYVF